MKLHLGCGEKYLQGYINIDAESAHADRKWNTLHVLPYENGSIEEILAIHLVEHLWPDEVPLCLSEWYRVLQPGGKLILEMPDILKAATNIVQERITEGRSGFTDKWCMWPIYGDNPKRSIYEVHKWGWTFTSLLPLTTRAGFSLVEEQDPQWHGRKTNRDFRVECTK